VLPAVALAAAGSAGSAAAAAGGAGSAAAAGAVPVDGVVMSPPMPFMGVVKSFTLEKGFGFLIPDGGGQDVFFHQNEIQNPDAGVLLAGQRVAFATKLDHGRTQAASVRVAVPGEVAAVQPVDPDAPSVHELVNQQIAWHLSAEERGAKVQE